MLILIKKRIDEALLHIPSGYKYVNSTNISSRNTVKVELARKTKSVYVSYETSTGSVKDTQSINVDIDALEIQESALTRVPEGYRVVSISGIQNNKVKVIVEKIVTTKDVKVNYVCEDKNIGSEVVTVNKDANTIDENNLQIPAGYKFVSASRINSQNTVKVELVRKTKSVRVNYQTSTGFVVTTQRINVDIDALEIQESALTRVPEGYKVVSISGIQKNAVTVIVEEIPTTQNVKVVYMNGDYKVGEEIVTIAKDANTVQESDLTIPENYKFVSASNINSQGIVKVEVQKLLKIVHVSYQTSTGMIKGRQRVIVEKNALEIQESKLTQVPEGYEVVSISAINNGKVVAIVEKIETTKQVKVNYVCNNQKIGEEVVSVDKKATVVDPSVLNIPEDYKYVDSTTITSHDTVKVELARKTKSVQVTYQTSTGVIKGTQRITVDIRALEIQESELTRVPEGYRVTAISGIVGRNVIVTVEEIPTTKDVKVAYFCNNEKVGEELVSVKIDATRVEKEDLQNIPLKYTFVSASNINSQGFVRVELARKTKSVHVSYETSTGVVKGTQRITVDIDALEIQESELTRVPEGYEVVSISGIQKNAVKVIVKEIVTTKDVKVVYFYNDEKLGDEIVTVDKDATRIEKDDLQNIPQGYKYVSSTNINSQGIVRVDLTRQTKSIIISYETSTGVVKGTQRVNVDIDALSVPESTFTRIPEGYKIVDVSLIQGHTLTVIVEKIVTTKDVKVVYVVDNDKIGEEIVNVDVDAKYIDQSLLTLPEGYDVKGITNINSHNVVIVTLTKVVTPEPEEKPEVKPEVKPNDEAKPSEGQDGNKKPATADTTAMLPWAMMMLAAGATATILKKKED